MTAPSAVTVLSKMESTNMLHGFIGVNGAVRPMRQLLATDQAPRANRRERTSN